jgi:glycosyltransferase involved in cell wall biosynthesis
VKIYWYWPHRHAASSALCRAALRPGDALTVHALEPAPGEQVSPIVEYDLIRDLPDPGRPGANRLSRVTRRPRVALARASARSHALRRNYDVAHIGNIFYQTDWADFHRLRRRVRLVCDVHDVRPHRRMMPAGIETLLLRTTYRSAHELVVLHDVLKQELVADFGVDPERVHVVPHVLDAHLDVDRACRGNGRPMFLFFGSLRSNKGLDVLSDALVKLGPQLDADVVIAGAGDAQTTASLHARLGTLAHVRVETGFVSPERKHDLFTRASWVLLPYTSFHSQSGVLADAYAYRVPLIVSNVGAIGPTVRDDATGLVVAPGDPAQLAEAMLRTRTSDTTQLERALDAAAARHDVAVVGARLRAIWDIAVSR